MVVIRPRVMNAEIDINVPQAKDIYAMIDSNQLLCITVR